MYLCIIDIGYQTLAAALLYAVLFRLAIELKYWRHRTRTTGRYLMHRMYCHKIV